MKHNFNSIKVILVTFSIFITLLSSAQNDKIVTLTTNGQGKTSEEAKNNALRSAIEQAFGAFVSSNTSVVNDNLIKDEIVSVSNGNISKYDILSEKTLPDNTWLVSVKADISPQNLVKFCESKGIKVDFKGALFAANVKIMELNKQNELKTIKNCFDVACDILPKSYDFSLDVSEPKSSLGKWKSDITVKAKLNYNMKIIVDLIASNLEALSIPEEQWSKYAELNIETYELQLLCAKQKKTNKLDNEKKRTDKKRKEQTENNQADNLDDLILRKYKFRNIETIQSVVYLFGELLYSHSSYFKINNGIETQNGFDIEFQSKFEKYGFKEPNRLNFRGSYTNYNRSVITKYNDPKEILIEYCGTFNSELWLRPRNLKSIKANFNDSKSYFISLFPDSRNPFFDILINMGFPNPGFKSYFFNLYSLQKDEIYFKILLSNILTSEEISKITQYTVEPIIQKNCDK